MTDSDYRAILGVSPTASKEEIRQKYRQLIMKHHPDRNRDDASSEETTKLLNEAYDYLYSQPDEIDELFADFFAKKPRTKLKTVSVTLEDAFVGSTITVDGTVLQIPVGTRTGTKLSKNKIVYQFEVMQHKKFKRSNDDLLVEASLSSLHAITGIDASLTHLDGTVLIFSVPAGIQNGQVVRLAGKGMQNPELDEVGDILIRINLVTPSVTEQDLQILKQLSNTTSISI